jgi:manganese transport system ATP-binding protein
MNGFVNASNLSVSYYGKEVVRGVSFSFKTGNLIGIIGPNGAGKSTLMKAVLGLVPRDSGRVEICGKPIKESQKNIAYVPQRSNIDWDFPILVRDTVLLGTYPKLRLFQKPRKSDKEWAYHCLEKVGMQNYSKTQIGELSGGQQQRVFIARALAQKASFFFLDEPFVGIDVASEKMIIDILQVLRDEGKTIFVVHHDLTKVKEYFDELILMNKELIESGPVQQVIRPELMTRAYRMDFHLLHKMGVEV